MKIKKVIAILTIALFAFSVVGCGNELPQEASTETSIEESSTEESTSKEEKTEKETTKKESETQKETTKPTEAKKSNDKEEESTQTTKPSEETKPTAKPTETSKPTETPKPTEAPKPAHEHSYSSSVTQASTCASNGVKTYTCSCGSSYTESIPATAHNWTERYGTIHHESQGEMRQVQVGTSDGYIECARCGATFATAADHDVHRKSFIGTDDQGHAFASCYTHAGEPIYEYQWIVTQEAYDEQVVTGYTCTVCGATQ